MWYWLSNFWRWWRERPIKVRGRNPSGIVLGVNMGRQWNDDWHHHINAIRQSTGLSFDRALQYRMLWEITNTNMRLGWLMQNAQKQNMVTENPFATVNKEA